MASGHRKRKAALVRAYVLNPAGLTNVAAADVGVLDNQNNLVNMAVYSKAGYAPTFTAGQATTLSNLLSNADGAWSGTGVNGATGVSGGEATFGVPSTTQHYYIPAVGTANSAQTGVTVPAIVYSYDGPQAKYEPYYLTDGIVGTSSISFNNTITGAAGTFPKLKIVLAGAVNASDNVNIYTGATTSTTKFSSTLVLSSSTNIYMNASVNTASLLGATDVLRVVFSSSAASANSTSLSTGWFVYVTGSN